MARLGDYSSQHLWRWKFISRHQHGDDIDDEDKNKVIWWMDLRGNVFSDDGVMDIGLWNYIDNQRSVIMMMKRLIPSVYICKTLVACFSALCCNTARHLINQGVVRGTDYNNEYDSDCGGGRNDKWHTETTAVRHLWTRSPIICTAHVSQLFKYNVYKYKKNTKRYKYSGKYLGQFIKLSVVYHTLDLRS